MEVVVEVVMVEGLVLEVVMVMAQEWVGAMEAKEALVEKAVLVAMEKRLHKLCGPC